ncbi:hypothetical protein [Sphingomonas sp.]|uniref:hypothetical protein n=1 Tax=Sphingomonas sp. TaxID=28214 RepID=UPI001EB86587|nr:hypothetical protein [Sphingomonas sp.]MBX3593063.1 hypothetical protein [Sphingomonas sp.]
MVLSIPGGWIVLIVAAILVRTGWASRGEALTLGLALDALRAIEPLYVTVADWLVAFGAFGLVMARDRRIRDRDVLERLRDQGWWPI